MLVSSFCLTNNIKPDSHVIRSLLTRLKSPFDSDFQRFLLPLCDLSLGYCASADVENDRAVGAIQATNMVEAQSRSAEEY